MKNKKKERKKEKREDKKARIYAVINGSVSIFEKKLNIENFWDTGILGHDLLNFKEDNPFKCCRENCARQN